MSDHSDHLALTDNEFEARRQFTPPGVGVPRIDVVLLHLFLGCDMLVTSRFYEFAGTVVRSPMLYVSMACVLIFTARMVQRSYLPEVGIVCLEIAGMLFQTVHFTTISRIPENFNSIGQFYPMFSFVVFSNFIGAGRVQPLLKTIYLYSMIYVVLYVVASLMVDANLIPGGLQERITQSDAERGARILIIAPLTLYCLYYSWFQVMAERKYLAVTMSLTSLAALMISQSRLLIVIVALIGFVAGALPRRSTVSIFAFVGFMAVSASILYGMYDTQWNPFGLFGGDTSALVRTRGYDSARQVLLAQPIFGAGIAASDEDMAAFTGNPTLQAADLGPIGIWFTFGLLGLMIYIVSVYAQCFCTRFGGCGTTQSNKALQYTSCVIGLFGCLTPTWFTGSPVWLFIALYLRGSRGMPGASGSYTAESIR